MKASKNLFAVLLTAIAIGPVFAGNGHGNDHGGDKHGNKHAEKHGDKHGRGHDDDRVRVVQRDRIVERVVIAEPSRVHANRSCPPGLAKKNNGCMPPGQAKKHQQVIVGEALPSGAVFVVPQRIRSTLPPPPAGYRYAVINNQVVLVSSGNIVVDIIRSLLG